jgi:hypothetical protein
MYTTLILQRVTKYNLLFNITTSGLKIQMQLTNTVEQIVLWRVVVVEERSYPQPFTEPENVLMCSENPVTVRYHEPDYFNSTSSNSSSLQ